MLSLGVRRLAIRYRPKVVKGIARCLYVEEAALLVLDDAINLVFSHLDCRRSA
jgi:hypothetical protein